MESVHFYIEGINNPQNLTISLSFAMGSNRPMNEAEMMFITTKVMFELDRLNQERMSKGKGVSDE